jgi:hypothetical protein
MLRGTFFNFDGAGGTVFFVFLTKKWHCCVQRKGHKPQKLQEGKMHMEFSFIK